MMMTFRVSLMNERLSPTAPAEQAPMRQNRYATPALMTLTEFVIVPRFTGHFER